MKRLFRTPLVMAGVLTLGLTACDTPTSVDTPTEEVTAESVAFENEQATEMLTAELSLTSVETSEVRAAVASINVVDRQPGWRWLLAARLQEVLPNEKKQRLISLSERFEERDIFGLVCFVGPGGLTGPDWRIPANFVHRLHIVRLIGNMLSAEQVEQIRAIEQEYHASVRELINAVKNGDLSREAFRSELNALIESVVAEIRLLLTDDQIAALEEILAERKQSFEEYVAATKRAMYAALDASDGQAAAIESLCDRLSAEKNALFAQFVAEELTREELKDALNNLNEIEKEELVVILNDKQFEIVQIHKALTLRWRRIDMRRHRDTATGDYNTGSGGPLFGDARSRDSRG